ncbi:MAG TPA: hypothetical protein VMU17_07175 [Elusimicrobiota bacterium]|nr:hypothetical protein [Elusimicrobiota bacterium]
MDPHEIQGAVTEAAGAAERKYGSVRERVADKVNDLRDRTREQAGPYWENTKDWVRENPAQSLGIACGVGFLLGALLAMRD